MWSNYSDRAVDLGTIAAYDISPVMMELFGLRQPATSSSLAVSSGRLPGQHPRHHPGEGRHRLERADPPAAEVEHEHWLLQYDLMFGKGYALSRMGLEELAEAAD